MLTLFGGLILVLSLNVYHSQVQTLDGEFVFSGFGDVYSMQVGDEEPTQITFGTRTDEAVWSPDGNAIAYVAYQNDNSEIFTMNADGTNVTQLTDNDESEFQITWAPDGRRIAFVSNRDGNREVYVMNTDGTDQVNLTNYPGWDEQPTWSPDSSRLAFVSDRDAADWEIYTISVDGSDLSRLTQSETINKLPAWSPDGTKIAFARSEVNGCERIFVINPDGTYETAVSEAICDLGQVEWLPGSSDILYLYNATIYQLTLVGSAQRVIILPTYGDYPTGFSYKANALVRPVRNQRLSTFIRHIRTLLAGWQQ